MRSAALLVILAPALALGACTVRREVAAPPAYSQASPYAPGAYFDRVTLYGMIIRDGRRL